MVSRRRNSTDQHRAFVNAARELGTDESEESFDRMLKRVAKAQPPKSARERKAKVKTKGR